MMRLVHTHAKFKAPKEKCQTCVVGTQPHVHFTEVAKIKKCTTCIADCIFICFILSLCMCKSEHLWNSMARCQCKRVCCGLYAEEFFKSSHVSKSIGIRDSNSHWSVANHLEWRRIQNTFLANGTWNYGNIETQHLRSKT